MSPNQYSQLSSEELVRLCAHSIEPDVWAEFIQRFGSIIALTVIRAARKWANTSAPSIDDLIQETYLKLCANECRILRDFKPSHPNSFFGYLKVVTTNVVNDHFRTLYARKRGSHEATEELDNVLYSESVAKSENEQERACLIAEIDRFLDQHIEGSERKRSRAIFWLYYRHGLSASAIAALPSINLSTKGVESAILRLTRIVRWGIVKTHAPQNRPPNAGFFSSESC